MKSHIILHPICMAAFPVLFLYSHNIGQASLGDLPFPLALSLTVAGLAWIAFSRWLGGKSEGALAATFFLLLFFTYGRVLHLAAHLVVGGEFLGRNRYLCIPYATAFAVGIYAIAKFRGRPGILRANSLANVFGLVMFALAASQLAWHMLADGPRPEGPRTRPIWETPRGADGAAGMPVATTRPQVLPDIYYIIPDSYEADSSLLEWFDFDNTPFTQELKAKGFVVASRSTSNYAFTLPSLASSLNMRMVTALADSMGRKSKDQSPLTTLISNNMVMAFLKKQGYTLVNAGSWWAPTFRNRNADINLQASRYNEFALKLLATTPLATYMEEFTENDLRTKTNYVFDNLGEIARMPEPTFTLAHLICPHPPYVFGPRGEKVSTLSRLASKAAPRSQYLDQVKYVNMKLIETVKTILENSITPPIIVIQGDHGAAYTRTGPVYVDAMPNDGYCREQMRIFNALLLPGVSDDAIPDSLTPVNTFRIVFNAYFGTGLSMLENRNQFSNRIMPYAFMDVTEKVRYPR